MEKLLFTIDDFSQHVKGRRDKTPRRTKQTSDVSTERQPYYAEDKSPNKSSDSILQDFIDRLTYTEPTKRSIFELIFYITQYIDGDKKIIRQKALQDLLPGYNKYIPPITEKNQGLDIIYDYYKVKFNNFVAAYNSFKKTLANNNARKNFKKLFPNVNEPLFSLMILFGLTSEEDNIIYYKKNERNLTLFKSLFFADQALDVFNYKNVKRLIEKLGGNFLFDLPTEYSDEYSMKYVIHTCVTQFIYRKLSESYYREINWFNNNTLQKKLEDIKNQHNTNQKIYNNIQDIDIKHAMETPAFLNINIYKLLYIIEKTESYAILRDENDKFAILSDESYKILLNCFTDNTVAVNIKTQLNDYLHAILKEQEYIQEQDAETKITLSTISLEKLNNEVSGIRLIRIAGLDTIDHIEVFTPDILITSIICKPGQGPLLIDRYESIRKAISEMTNTDATYTTDLQELFNLAIENRSFMKEEFEEYLDVPFLKVLTDIGYKINEDPEDNLKSLYIAKIAFNNAFWFAEVRTMWGLEKKDCEKYYKSWFIKLVEQLKVAMVPLIGNSIKINMPYILNQTRSWGLSTDFSGYDDEVLHMESESYNYQQRVKQLEMYAAGALMLSRISPNIIQTLKNKCNAKLKFTSKVSLGTLTSLLLFVYYIFNAEFEKVQTCISNVACAGEVTVATLQSTLPINQLVIESQKTNTTDTSYYLTQSTVEAISSIDCNDVVSCIKSGVYAAWVKSIVVVPGNYLMGALELIPRPILEFMSNVLFMEWNNAKIVLNFLAYGQIGFAFIRYFGIREKVISSLQTCLQIFRKNNIHVPELVEKILKLFLIVFFNGQKHMFQFLIPLTVAATVDGFKQKYKRSLKYFTWVTAFESFLRSFTTILFIMNWWGVEQKLASAVCLSIIDFFIPYIKKLVETNMDEDTKELVNKRFSNMYGFLDNLKYYVSLPQMMILELYPSILNIIIDFVNERNTITKALDEKFSKAGYETTIFKPLYNYLDAKADKNKKSMMLDNLRYFIADMNGRVQQNNAPDNLQFLMLEVGRKYKYIGSIIADEIHNINTSGDVRVDWNRSQTRLKKLCELLLVDQLMP